MLLVPCLPLFAQPVQPAGVIAQAIAAMGGEARLTSLHSLTLDTIGHAFALEQSERPEGPWLTVYQQTLEVRDLEHQRRWVQTQHRDWSSPQWSKPLAMVTAGGMAARTDGQRWAPATPADLHNSEEMLALAPERLLLTARAASDLHAMPEETQQRVPQQVLAFTWAGKPLRLFLNRWTHLPTMLEVVQDDPMGVWGDVVERRWYAYWTLETGGLMYPRQTSVERNGQPFTDDTVQVLKIDEAADESKFAIPENVKTAFASAPPRPSGWAGLQLDESKAVAVNDWIVQLPGGFNVLLVRQPDGLVIIEATTSSAYSSAVLAAAEKRFPGVKIKALVTTSDAWPHMAGIREYVARGIAIYPLDWNVPILTSLIQSKRTFSPDTLQQQRKAPVFRPVSGRTVLGAGETRLELIPVRGETGERAMLVWFPGAHLLYSSDLIQRSRAGGFFMPEMLTEVQAAVQRENIDGIERVIGMHLAPTPWADVIRAIHVAKGDQ